jgi:hypothetical protein
MRKIGISKPPIALPDFNIMQRKRAVLVVQTAYPFSCGQDYHPIKISEILKVTLFKSYERFIKLN